MKALRWLIAVAAMAFVLPAHAATTDPIQVIYRTSGVTQLTAATVIHCTNLSAVPEIVRVVVRGETGAILANVELPVANFRTVTFSTASTALFPGEVPLPTGGFVRGTAVVAAISVFLFCSAMIVEAANPFPEGIA